MQPALFSESSLTINQNDMSVFKKFADALSGRSKVSKDDVALLKGMFSELSEEEKQEVAPKVEELEAKAEEVTPPEPKAEEGETPESITASEMNLKFAEMGKELAELRKRESERNVNDHVESLILSEAGKPGFSKTDENVSSLKAFVATLSEGQVAQFKALMDHVTVLSEENFRAIGGAGSDVSSVDAKLDEVTRLSEEFIKGGMKKTDAIAKAQKMIFSSK